MLYAGELPEIELASICLGELNAAVFVSCWIEIGMRRRSVCRHGAISRLPLIRKRHYYHYQSSQSLPIQEQGGGFLHYLSHCLL